MKHIVLFIFLIIPILSIAQDIEIISPLMHEGSVNVASVPMDNNGNPCAKIIVDIPLEGAVIEGSYIVGNVKEKAGRYEFFVSVPKKNGQKFSVRHSNYSSIDIPIWTADGALLPKEAYIVKLKASSDDKIIVDMHGNKVDVENKNVEVIVHDDAGGQYLVMKVSPSDASVEIDGQSVSSREGSLQKFLLYGTHTYRVNHPMHETKSGTFDIGKEKVNVNVVLTPIFGYLMVSTTPESDADVYIDGEKLGTTPYRSKVLKEGQYRVRVAKDMYESKERTVAVKRNNTTQVDISMLPTFGEVFIKCKDAKASLTLDGLNIGTGTWNGRVERGNHLLEAAHKSHRSILKTIDVTANTQATFEIDAPTPIVGSLNISSDPIGAKILIDGKEVGETPNIINNILIGSHDITLSKQGCGDYETIINIEEGKFTTLETTLEKGKDVAITTDREGDDIYVDGNLIGKSPIISTLSFGEHSVYAKRGIDKTEVKTIYISTTTNINVNLDFGLTFTVNGASFVMKKVDGGSFLMGSNDLKAYNHEKPVHNVTLSTFYISKTEVTQELWKAVMGSNPSSFKGDNLPVENVSWNDCQVFINKLNILTGKQFRLPSEAEWEYAARGGKNSQGYKYSGSNEIDKVCWHDNNSGNNTHQVCTMSPNELGIYDMSGNVWEWCSDCYGDYGMPLGSNRVSRGGSYLDNAKLCRSSFRLFFHPNYRFNYLGLRLALDI